MFVLENELGFDVVQGLKKPEIEAKNETELETSS